MDLAAAPWPNVTVRRSAAPRPPLFRRVGVRPAYAASDNPFASDSWRREPSRKRRLGMPGWAFTMLASAATAVVLGYAYQKGSGQRGTPAPPMLLPMVALIFCGLAIVTPSLAIAREMERLKRSTLFSQVFLTPATHVDVLFPAMRAVAVEFGRILLASAAGIALMPGFLDDLSFWWERRTGLGAPIIYISLLFPVTLWFNSAVAGWVACHTASKMARMFFSMLAACLPFLFFSVQVRFMSLPEVLLLHGCGLSLIAWALERLIRAREAGARFWADNLAEEEIAASGS